MPPTPYQTVQKWLSTDDLHLKLSNFLRDAAWITNAQITQVLNFCYGNSMGNYRKKHAFKQDISPLYDLCPLRENDTCLHLLSCYTNKHINNIHTNQYNKAVHGIARTLLAYFTTRCFTLINVCKIQDTPLDNTIPTWLLPCSCYLLRCKCLARLHPDILYLPGTTPSNQATSAPS
jgi:hypothetical protein